MYCCWEQCVNICINSLSFLFYWVEKKIVQFPTVSKFEPSCILKTNHIFELSKQEVASNHWAISGRTCALVMCLCRSSGKRRDARITAPLKHYLWDPVIAGNNYKNFNPLISTYIKFLKFTVAFSYREWGRKPPSVLWLCSLHVHEHVKDD